MVAAEDDFGATVGHALNAMRIWDMVFPPLLLLSPRGPGEPPFKSHGHGDGGHGGDHGHGSDHGHGGEHGHDEEHALGSDHGHSIDHHAHDDHHGGTDGLTGVALAFFFVFLTLFRFASMGSLTAAKNVSFVPLMWFRVAAESELLTFAFWYVVFVVATLAFFSYRPPNLSKKLLVPEVVALLVLAAADTALVVVGEHDENEFDAAIMAGSAPQVPWQTGYIGGIIDDLPRLWFIINLVVLISATLRGCISPPGGTLKGAIFDVTWALVVSQLVALTLHRAATRHNDMVVHVLTQNTYLAVACGLSALAFTHSLAMSLAIVFRTHEHEHVVPTFGQTIRILSHKKAAKCIVFCAALYVYNNQLDPGMLYKPHEEMIIMLLNTVALLVYANVQLSGKRGHVHANWEATLLMAVGSLASLCWWSELFSSDALESLGIQRTLCISQCAVTHFCMTILSVDVFRCRLDPGPNQCLFLTFWACTMLFMGAKLEHHAACAHHDHHREGHEIWEIMAHLGEFGLCEYGIISTMAWLTHLAQNADRWWHVRPTGLAEPLLDKSA